METYTYGKHAVESLLLSDTEVDKLFVLRNAPLGKLYGIAKEKGIEIRTVDRKKLDELSNNGNHQGVAALSGGYSYCDLDDFLSENKNSLIVMLDGIEDPHNLGAILRTAECSGAELVIIPKRRSAWVNETVRKVASGAADLVKVAQVTNLTRTVKLLKENGYWIFGADMSGDLYYNAPLERPLVLVIGGEGRGISRLVRENLDGTISIPLKGKIKSLNASNACAVLLYEVVRRESV